MKQVLFVFLCCVALAALAQPYPSRPVRMVIPQPPGGTMDTVMRGLGEQLSRQMGQQFVIDNRSGANGVIAGEIVAKAPGDGYTMLYTSNSLANNQLVMEKPPFNVLRDFLPVTQVVRSQGYYVVINPQLPVQSFKELVAYSRTAQVHYGSGGVGNSQHLMGELINKRVGAKFVHVPYKGFAPVITAVIGNEIQLAFASPLTVVPHIKANRLRALAGSGARRWAGLPDVPTLSEAGMPGFVYDPAWHAIFAPAALAAALAVQVQGEVAKALESAKMRELMAAGGHVPVASAPPAFRKFLEGYLKDMAALAQETGVKPL